MSDQRIIQRRGKSYCWSCGKELKEHTFERRAKVFVLRNRGITDSPAEWVEIEPTPLLNIGRKCQLA